MRVILVTGKGGVGKTTVAAATAVRAAALGKRVLVTSTDPAHSLGDVLDVRIAHEPREVSPGCWAQELSTRQAAHDAWTTIGAYVEQVLGWIGVGSVEAEELAVVPGAEELLALANLHRSIAEGGYDVVVVDCAPSAETLRLLTLPHVLGLLAARAGLDTSAGRFFTRLIGSGLHLPRPSAEVLDAVENLEDDVVKLQGLLACHATTTARVVTTPDRVVVKEALRTYTYLSLFGYCVDAVVVNRVLPSDVDEGLLGALAAQQRAQLDEIDRRFGEVARLKAPQMSAEPIGTSRLTALGSSLFPDDPTAVLANASSVTVAARGDRRVLAFPAPGLTAGEVQLDRRGDEIHVRIGERRRALTIPDSLRHREVVAAGMRRGRVEVVFEEAS